MKTRRLTKKEMWIFAIGQLGWSILSGIVTTWLVTYYLPTESSVEAGALFYVPTGLIVFGVPEAHSPLCLRRVQLQMFLGSSLPAFA